MSIGDRREHPHSVDLTGADMGSIRRLDELELHFKLWTPHRLKEPRLIMFGEGRGAGQLMAMRSQVTTLGPFDELDDLIAAMGTFTTDCYEATLTAGLAEQE